jgi:hypothetical protein
VRRGERHLVLVEGGDVVLGLGEGAPESLFDDADVGEVRHGDGQLGGQAIMLAL